MSETATKENHTLRSKLGRANSLLAKFQSSHAEQMATLRSMAHQLRAVVQLFMAAPRCRRGDDQFFLVAVPPNMRRRHARTDDMILATASENLSNDLARGEHEETLPGKVSALRIAHANVADATACLTARISELERELKDHKATLEWQDEVIKRNRRQWHAAQRAVEKVVFGSPVCDTSVPPEQVIREIEDIALMIGNATQSATSQRAVAAERNFATLRGETEELRRAVNDLSNRAKAWKALAILRGELLRVHSIEEPEPADPIVEQRAQTAHEAQAATAISAESEAA